MELNGPAERLFINHVDQDERQRETQNEADEIRQQPNQSRFQQNQFANL